MKIQDSTKAAAKALGLTIKKAPGFGRFAVYTLIDKKTKEQVGPYGMNESALIEEIKKLSK